MQEQSFNRGPSFARRVDPGLPEEALRHPKSPEVGPSRWPFSLEKRYIDVLAADGTVLLVYLGWLSLAGLKIRRVTADLFRPGEPARSGAAAGSGPRGRDDWLDYGAARIDGEELSFETPGLSGRLRFRARYAPVSPREPLLRDGSHQLQWTVEVPDSDAEGELRWPGGSLALAGRGYRDRIWTDLPPWRPTLRKLEWGRIAAAGHASTWLRLDAAAEQISAGWLDGQIVPDAACRGSLQGGRIIVDAAFIDLEGLAFGALRPILRRLGRDPRGVKWACGAELLGASGVAIHEEVTWR